MFCNCLKGIALENAYRIYRATKFLGLNNKLTTMANVRNRLSRQFFRKKLNY